MALQSTLRPEEQEQRRCQLLVDAPITCWLAIDSRLVVASIEDHFGDRFSKAGLDGYQWLEKIVQLPFCIPDLDTPVKNNFLQKLLEGGELKPLRIYKRLQFLEDTNMEEISNVFTSGLSESIETEEVAFQALIPVLRKMIEFNTFSDDRTISETAIISTSSPKEALGNVEYNSYDTTIPSHQRLQDTFLHWVSVGIGMNRHEIN
jgi:hypothetical protein